MGIGDLEEADADDRVFTNGVPCPNPGCRWHVTHPCEMCGRRSCVGVAVVKTGYLRVSREQEEE